MPFDGSGNFNRVMNWVNDALANIKILATRHDSEDDNFAAGLSNCITKDGQSQPTANIPMNGKRITNLANPVNPQDAMTLAQMMASNVRYDVTQALTIAQQLQAHVNLASTASVAIKAGPTYTLVQSDRNKLLRITGANVVTLPTAATVGNDFAFQFRTEGGALTLHPTGGALVEGLAADYVIPDLAYGMVWCDGTNWQVVNSTRGAPVVSVLTSSGTYTKSPGLKALLVVVSGCGGGVADTPACTTGNSVAVGGGAGAGVSVKMYKASDLPATVAYTVGTGLKGAGGASIFSGQTGNGGGGGVANAAGSTFAGALPGTGGSASGGDLNFTGQNGGMGVRAAHGVATAAYAGDGGASHLGVGSAGTYPTVAGGSTGNFPGGGARGGGSGGAQSAQAGTSGGQGAIILTEYF